MTEGEKLEWKLICQINVAVAAYRERTDKVPSTVRPDEMSGTAFGEAYVLAVALMRCPIGRWQSDELPGLGIPFLSEVLKEIQTLNSAATVSR